uniref:Uncharacterized protein n=1 Tax=Aegilops tauschii subsp. strangulata TaxID=200361 RepID=A0A453J5W8_AEGTS
MAVGAVGVEAGHGSPLAYGGELTFNVVMTCLVAASGGLIFGYDIGISGQIHPQLTYDLARRARLVSDLLQTVVKFRRRLADEALLADLLPQGAQADGGREAEPVLHLRQPRADLLHLVPVHRRPRLVLRRWPRHQVAGAAWRDAAGRGAVLRGRRHDRRGDEPRHAHRRAHAARLRRRVHQPGHPAVPRRDGPRAVARLPRRRLPVLPRPRDPHRQPRQLRHRAPRVGLEALPRPRRRAGHRHLCGRSLPHRHAQQLHHAREGRPRPVGAPPGARGQRERGRRAQGHHARRGGRAQQRGRRVPEAVRRPAVPPAPDILRRGAVLPPAERHDGADLLLAAGVPHRRLRKQRGADGRGHPRRRQVRLAHPLHAGDRPLRPQGAGHGGRGDHGRMPGRERVDHGGASRQRPDTAGLRGGAAGAHLRAGRRVRHVVGAAHLDHPRRDLPDGDTVGGAVGERVDHAGAHLPADADLPRPAMPAQVRHVRLLRSLGGGPHGLRLGLPAGDQGRPPRVHGLRLGAPLVLEEVRRRRPRPGQTSFISVCINMSYVFVCPFKDNLDVPVSVKKENLVCRARMLG